MDIEKIVREYLPQIIHMSLGTSKDNKPWVCEVHFVYDEKLNLYFCSKVDTRHCKEIEANPNVAGDIVRQHDLTESPHGIYFEGTAEIIKSPSDEDISRYSDQLKRDAEELKVMLNEDGGRKMYKITVSNWYAFGKFGTDTNKKYHLDWNGGAK